MGLPVLAVVAYAQSFADGVHTSIPAPGLGALGAGRGGKESPLARSLAKLGVGADDIAVISKHDTSTLANDPNETELHERLADSLGRSEGAPLFVVSQKSLTGHAKGGAAVFQMMGLCQILRDGVIPPNRSLDCVDDEMAGSAHFVWLRETLRLGEKFPLKAGMVTSLGFGHVSGLVALVHPQAFIASLDPDQRADYQRRADARVLAGQRRLASAIAGGAPMYERPADRRFDHDAPEKRQEATMLLNPASRLGDGDGSTRSRPDDFGHPLAWRAMGIVGVGIDLVSIPDFAEQVDQPGTVFSETFTPGERRDASDKSSSAARHLAARWAAKEAVIKAWSGSRFAQRPVLREDIHRDIEVVTDMWGRPRVRLTGAIAEASGRRDDPCVADARRGHRGRGGHFGNALMTMPRACVSPTTRRVRSGFCARSRRPTSLELMSDLVERVREVLPSVRRDLEDLVRIESVWADPAAATRYIAARRRWRICCRRPGFGEVQIVSEGGAPAVIAQHPAPPGAPTVLLYAHHDVQPEGDRGQWASPPFEPTERDGRLYGRGSADDKAGIATHLAAFRAHGGQPPVGVTVFVEGEEESGSPSLGRLLAAHRDTLAADVIVIADSDNWSTDIPALTVSLRGLVDCVVEVATLDHGLHSGIVGRRGSRRAERAGAAAGQPARRRRQRGRRRSARKYRRRLWITRPSGCVPTPACWTGCPRSARVRCRSGCGPNRRSP